MKDQVQKAKAGVNDYPKRWFLLLKSFFKINSVFVKQCAFVVKLIS